MSDEDYSPAIIDDDNYSEVMEEGAMHWCINDFSDLLKSRGVDTVLAAMPKEVEELLYWHYYRQITPVREDL